MPTPSAGLVMFRETDAGLEVLLVHPGGPFWAKKDLGSWSIPKGEIGSGEDPLAAAVREMEEETGVAAGGPFLSLGTLRQKSGKVVHAFAFRGDCDAAAVRSNDFEMEWPPRSGKKQRFPEVDRADWFPLDEARRRILPGQAEFLSRLEAACSQ